MKTFRLLLPLLAVTVVACKSSDEGQGDGMALTFGATPEMDCTCGTADADAYGCLHGACVSQAGNSDNELCACGPLYTEDTANKMYTSTGSGAVTSRLLGARQNLLMANGRRLVGTLVSDTGEVIEVRTESGSTVSASYKELDPRSVFRLMKGHTPAEDGEGQLAVARYAGEHGLYAHAKRHYDLALRADPSLKEEIEADLAQVDNAVAAGELARAQEEVKKGNTRRAEEHLARILNEYPDSAASKEASQILGQIASAADEERTRSVRDLSAEIQKELGRAKRSYERAVERNRAGLLASDKQSRALNLFKSSYKDGEKARRELGKVRDKHAEDQEFLDATAKYDQVVVDEMVQAQLNMSSIYLIRRSYNAALGAANTALAIDPKSQAAMNMRARVEVAASSSDIF